MIDQPNEFSPKKLDIDTAERLELRYNSQIEREVVIVTALGLENQETATNGDKIFQSYYWN